MEKTAQLTKAGDIKIGNIHQIHELSGGTFTVLMNDGSQREITEKTLVILQDRYASEGGQNFPTIKWYEKQAPFNYISDGVNTD